MSRSTRTPLMPEVAVHADSDMVRVTVTDDGLGGAAEGGGSGLCGLLERTDALGGKFSVSSSGTWDHRSRALPLAAAARAS